LLGSSGGRSFIDFAVSRLTGETIRISKIQDPAVCLIKIFEIIPLFHGLTFAYNRKLEETPFHPSHALSLPEEMPNPFKADTKTIRTLKKKLYGVW
jgi:hypothetical protein